MGRYFRVVVIQSAILLFTAISSLTAGEEQASGAMSDSSSIQHIKSIDLPEQIEFAGELVPLDLFDVRESLEREMLSNVYFHSQTIRLIKMAHRYFALIEPVLKANLVPDDFKYLAVAESGLTQAVSPAKAVGFWQLMKGTALDYGLEVNAEVDERYHIGLSTEVACAYLIESYKKYGNWTMTAASYNAGRRGVDRQIERQKQENYYDLLLNEETGRYIFRILAFKLIFENPEAYGFHLDEEDMYEEIPFYEVELDSAVRNFADYAAYFDTNYKMLKYLNPWLRDNKLSNPQSKTYLLAIPEKGYRRPEAGVIE